MTVKMDKFLLQYFMQLHFNEMPPEKRKTFIKYIEGGDDFTKDSDMKIWKRDLVHQDTDGKWVNNEIPDGNVPTPPAAPDSNPWAMDDEEWKKLYIEFRNAFRTMSANKSKFANSSDPDTYNADAAAFLHDNFGDPTPPADKLFSSVTANTDAETEIANLLQMLNDASLAPTFSVKLNEWGIISASDLKDGLTKKTYNTDDEFQQKLKRVSEYLSFYKDELGITGCDFDKIQNGFDEKHVDDAKLAEFKTRHKDLLRIVAKNKKIQEQFPANKITSAMDEAKKKTAYEDTNSPNFLVDSQNDTLTPLQQFEKWRKDTYSDVFEKWKLLQGDRLYFSPQASKIVAALDKEKVKPTDGLDGITKVANNVKNELLKKSASAAKHFGWLSETLVDIKNVMPKSYEGALSHGTQLNAVIEELITRAIRDDKIDEAKTAMEVISVCKYGLTTSKIMDKLSKEKLTLLSDPKLSINSNEFTKVFGVVMDKTLETMLKGIGYTITAIGNTINKSGSKFKGRRDKIDANAQAWEVQNAADKATADRERTTKNAADDAVRRAETTRRDSTGITDDNLAMYERHQERGKQIEAQRKSQFENAQAALNTANQTYQEKKRAKDAFQATIDKYNTELPQKISDLGDESTRLRNEYNRIKAQLTTIPTPYANAMDELKAKQLQEKYNQLYEQRKQKLSERRNLEDELRTGKAPGGEYEVANNSIANAITEETNAQTALNNEQNAFNRAEQRYNATQASNNDRADKIKTFRDSRDKIKELTEQINRRDTIVSEWDNKHVNQWNELRDYWNYLETGRDSRTGDFYNRLTMSKKKAQSNYDAEKMAKFMQFKQQHTIAA